jgi:diaminohydroxyphosphoribosylaminopyrimidine deaminase/5-amino-6-(5-phosphoribosylamino)uracil reductase
VDGKGIEKLKAAGITVVTGVLEDECRRLNKRFFTRVQKHRP